MNLEDGIYLRTYVEGGIYYYSTRFVKDNRAYNSYPDGMYSPPSGGYKWERISDLPAPPMTEPTEIGYPVMAKLFRSGPEILFVRSFSTHGIRWCSASGAAVAWEDLFNPRNLTDNEIYMKNIWTGEKR